MDQIHKSHIDMKEEEEFEDVLNSGFKLYKLLYDKLYDYQRKGLVFLYKAYEEGKKGVILADEMGLGKSIQVIAFLSGMMDTEKIKNVLLVMPPTLKKDWVDKLTRWTPGMKWQFYHFTEENPARNLRSVQAGGDVLLTSYRMLVYNRTAFSFYKNKPFVWDCVIFDEAHMMKNHTTKAFMVASEIQAKFTVLLTGTPVQSNLQGMWELFSIVTPSDLLGDYYHFKTVYKDPITRATDADASPMERAWGKEMLWRLQKMIEPYFIRRTKNTNEIPHLPKKIELVVWIRLSPKQQAMYQNFISSKGPSTQANFSLLDLHTLKRICNHPRCFNKDYQYHVPLEILLAESGKLAFLVPLLKRLLEEGHRILLFSQSLKMLDIVQCILEKMNLGPLLRIDGATHLHERERQCELFQKNTRYRILLFTTKVGAVGLTLTSASRVVIVDPSWSQAVDSQAVNQAYRLGQKQKLVVYHLITCGTVEEKFYRKQVFRSVLGKQIMSNSKNPSPPFTKDDLRDLLPLGETQFSVTQRLLDSSCPQPQQLVDEDLKSHLDFLETLNICSVSDYKCLLPSKQVEDMMEEMATMPFRAQSEKAKAGLKIRRKTRMSMRASVGWIDMKENLEKHVVHRKLDIPEGGKDATSLYTMNRKRQLLRKNLTLENESKHSGMQGMNSNRTDLGTNTENMMKNFRMDSMRKSSSLMGNTVTTHNISYFADECTTNAADDTALQNASEPETTAVDETDSKTPSSLPNGSKATPPASNRHPPPFVSLKPCLKSNMKPHLVQQHLGDLKVAVDSPKPASQPRSKLHCADRLLCDYSLTPGSISPSSLLSEDEYSDQQGSSSKPGGQTKEESIICGLAAISERVPVADVIRKKSNSSKRKCRSKPAVAQNYFTSPYDADKWTQLIGTPVFSDSESESLLWSGTEELLAEDGNSSGTEIITESISTPSEPQINSPERSPSHMGSTVSFESTMSADNRTIMSQGLSSRHAQIPLSPRACFKKAENQQPSQPHFILTEVLHKNLKQRSSSASSVLMAHPLKASALLDSDCKENCYQSNVSTHYGQGTSSRSMMDITFYPNTSARVADRRMVHSGETNEVHPIRKSIESSIHSAQSAVATDDRLIKTLETLLQILKK